MKQAGPSMKAVTNSMQMVKESRDAYLESALAYSFPAGHKSHMWSVKADAESKESPSCTDMKFQQHSIAVMTCCPFWHQKHIMPLPKVFIASQHMWDPRILPPIIQYLVQQYPEKSLSSLEGWLAHPNMTHPTMKGVTNKLLWRYKQHLPYGTILGVGLKAQRGARLWCGKRASSRSYKFRWEDCRICRKWNWVSLQHTLQKYHLLSMHIVWHSEAIIIGGYRQVAANVVRRHPAFLNYLLPKNVSLQWWPTK